MMDKKIIEISEEISQKIDGILAEIATVIETMTPENISDLQETYQALISLSGQLQNHAEKIESAARAMDEKSETVG